MPLKSGFISIRDSGYVIWNRFLHILSDFVDGMGIFTVYTLDTCKSPLSRGCQTFTTRTTASLQGYRGAASLHQRQTLACGDRGLACGAVLGSRLGSFERGQAPTSQGSGDDMASVDQARSKLWCFHCHPLSSGQAGIESELVKESGRRLRTTDCGLQIHKRFRNQFYTIKKL
jgi:hypothetical protein